MLSIDELLKLIHNNGISTTIFVIILSGLYVVVKTDWF